MLVFNLDVTSVVYTRPENPVPIQMYKREYTWPWTSVDKKCTYY